MSDTKLGRRQFVIQVGGFGVAMVAMSSGLPLLAGCGAKEEAEEMAAQPHSAISAAQRAADPCHDLAGLSAGDLATRETFKYEKRSSDPTQYCQACNFWQADRQGGPCGTCTIVRGPIHPLGRCRSWVERSES